MYGVLSRSLRLVLSPVVLAIWVLIALAAAAVGPLDTYSNLTLPQRGLYWGAICGVSVFLANILRELAVKTIPAELVWLSANSGVAGTTLFFSPFVFFLTLHMIGQSNRVAPSFLKVSVLVALLSTVIQTIKRIHSKASPQSEFLGGETGALGFAHLPTPIEIVPSPPTPEPPRLMRRLPEGAQGPVLHLSARDHFVDVELPHETHSVRMRFVDAIAELDGVEGYCTHRSHWVTSSAVTGAERDNGRLFLRLTSGTLVPVSRTYRPQLEQAGLV